MSVFSFFLYTNTCTIMSEKLANQLEYAILSHTGGINWAYSSQCLDEFTLWGDQPLYTKLSESNFPNSSSLLSSHSLFPFISCAVFFFICLSSLHLVYIPLKAWRGVKEHKVCKKKEGALTAREGWEIYSKLMEYKDNVSLIFNPIILWLML